MKILFSVAHACEDHYHHSFELEKCFIDLLFSLEKEMLFVFEAILPKSRKDVERM